MRRAYANDVVPRAVGAASRLAEESAAYKAKIVAQAQGDAQRFASVLAEYQKAPQVTRDRMYIDAMQQIYGNVTKVIIESRQGSNLLYMPLDKLMQSTGNAASSSSLEIPPSSAVTPSTVPSTAVPLETRARDSGRTREREVR